MNDSTFSNISLSDTKIISKDDSFCEERISRPSRRMSMEYMTVAYRSSTPVKTPASTPMKKKFSKGFIAKRKRNSSEHILEESTDSKGRQDRKQDTESFFSFAKRLRSSESTKNLYDITRRPIKRKQSSTNKCDFNISTNSSVVNESSSFINITLHKSKNNNSVSSAANEFSFMEATEYFEEVSKRSKDNEARKSKKRRASDIGIKEIFVNSKRSQMRAKKNVEMNKKTTNSAKNVKECNKVILQDVLSSKFGLLEFRQFLQTEFSEENIDFWIECEIYKHQKGSKLRKLAIGIFNKYVTEHAPREVNLDCKTKQVTATNVLNPTCNTFDEAQEKIYKLMESDSFQRFLSSSPTISEKLVAKENRNNVVKNIINNGRRRLSL